MKFRYASIGIYNNYYIWLVKKLDKLKRQRYEISMKIIALETKAQKSKLNKNELKELEILQTKEVDLENRINNM